MEQTRTVSRLSGPFSSVPTRPDNRGFYCICRRLQLFIKVAPYSFLTTREQVSKSRNGASIKKSTRKSRATSLHRKWLALVEF